MDQEDFLQGVTQNSPGRSVCSVRCRYSKQFADRGHSTWCQNLGRDWCNFAYMLKESSVTHGTPVKASRGDRVKTHCASRHAHLECAMLIFISDKLNSTTDLWDQSLYINDELVSHVSTSKGQHGKIFYVSVECAAQPCTTVPAHSMYTLSSVKVGKNRLHLNRLGEHHRHFEPSGSVVRAHRVVGAWCYWRSDVDNGQWEDMEIL